MSWASKRQTTRPEDRAYCLFGIFSVNMSPLYGEGSTKAFRRLQEEIMKTSTDLSIIVWREPRPHTSAGALAWGPKCFSSHQSIIAVDTEIEHSSITNMGLRIKLPLIVDSSGDKCTAILSSCRYDGKPGTFIGLRLTRLDVSSRNADGGVRALWCRDETLNEPVFPIQASALQTSTLAKIYLYINVPFSDRQR
jgi:hypothetical protein